MLKNYLRVAFRNFRKQKYYTFIHIVGLTLGLICSLLIFMFVHFHFSTDHFYPHVNRIYRVVLDMQLEDGSTEYESGSSLPMPKALLNEFTGIEQTGFYMQFYSAPLIAITEKDGQVNLYTEPNGVAYADTDFLKMFDFQLIEGNLETTLSAPNQVILSERQALKYFGQTEVLGKTIRINDKTDLLVTGIMANSPENTAFRTDVWISLPTLKVLQPSYQTENFTWIGRNNWTFVKLSEQNDFASINQQLPNFVLKFLGQDFEHWQFQLQPLAEMHFDTRYGGVIRKSMLTLLSTVAIFIIVIACINFINLSTAQALSRAKEVGVRKVLGSSRKQLFWQFISETSLIVCTSALVAIISVALVLPLLNNWIQANLTLNQLAKPQLIVSILLVLLIVIVLSGAYPAFVLSGFQPIKSLKGKVSSKETGGFTLRKVLVTVQFTIAMIFMMGAFVLLFQMEYFQQAEVGFTKDAIVTVKVPRSEYSTLETFRNQLLEHTAIEEISFHHLPPMASVNEGGYIKYDNREKWEPFMVRDRWADDKFLDTYDLELIAGRNLMMRDSVTEFLVNEEFVKKLGIASPEEVLDKHLVEGNAAVSGKIVGVVKNFHHSSLQNPIEPVTIYAYPVLFRQAGIHLQNAQLQQSLKIIEAAWNATFPNQVFEYQFLDETLAQLYSKEQLIARLTRIFTIVSIIICCLGLLGLVTYSARQRTKEIGVRKVLGASVSSILLLLGKDFIQLILIAFLIAIPFSNYFMSDWLQGFAYRIRLSWWMFSLPGILVLAIALFSVFGQTWKAARQNPVDSLRNE